MATCTIETSSYPIVARRPCKEADMHLHLCSQCRAIITVDEGRTCPSNNDPDEGLCEACALAQPRFDEIISAPLPEDA